MFQELSCCFAALCQLYQILRYITDDRFHSLVMVFICSRLNYGNIVLVEVPAYLQRCLQSVLNAVALPLSRLHRYDHVMDRAVERLIFLIALLMALIFLNA